MSSSQAPSIPIGQTKVSKLFLRDFAELANRYHWSADDIEEMKQFVRDGGRAYLETLAKAHRDGYEQTEENNFIRLDRWLDTRKK